MSRRGPAADERRSGFVSGLIVGGAAALAGVALVAALTGSELSGDTLTGQARELVEQNYFQDVDSDELDSASVRGIVTQLRKEFDDPFSHYFAPDEFEEFEAAMSGEFEGVGLTVSEVARGLRIARVLPDSPAAGADLAEGDVIVGVDGESIAGVPSEAATAQIKGEPGTEVDLRIDPVRGKQTEITLERATVRLPTAVGEIRRTTDGTEVAYVQFAGFDPGAHGELRTEIERLFREGAEGLVLDLRGNPGGRLNEAILASSLFVEEGDVVTTSGRTTGDEVYEATGDAFEPRPTAVLINGDTASAAEILAAAIQSYDLGTIVGEPSFGKGSVQQQIELSNGGAINLTVAEYLTADGVSLADEGVEPDVEAVDDERTRRDEALDRALSLLASEL